MSLGRLRPTILGMGFIGKGRTSTHAVVARRASEGADSQESRDEFACSIDTASVRHTKCRARIWMKGMSDRCSRLELVARKRKSGFER